MRLPNKYIVKEIELQRYLETKLVRGKIDFILSVKFLNTNELKKSLNTELIESYYEEINKLSTKLQIGTEGVLNSLLNMPDAISPAFTTENIDETDWKNILSVINNAMTSFDDFRANEGRELQKELISYKHNILSYVEQIDKSKDKRIIKIKNRLQSKLEEIKQENIDNSRLEQELIYYLEKLDITEEIERLKTHLDYYEKSLKEVNNGKKLGFISQEIGREINTIGSKANDSDIQHTVVLMKNELEKIKQQLSNIL